MAYNFVKSFHFTSLYVSLRHSPSLYVTLHHSTSLYVTLRHSTSLYVTLGLHYLRLISCSENRRTKKALPAHKYIPTHFKHACCFHPFFTHPHKYKKPTVHALPPFSLRIPKKQTQNYAHTSGGASPLFVAGSQLKACFHVGCSRCSCSCCCCCCCSVVLSLMPDSFGTRSPRPPSPSPLAPMPPGVDGKS
jgi:hypothetical protein